MSLFQSSQKLIEEHSFEYGNFTRLLLTISIAIVTIISSSKNTVNVFQSISLALLFISVLFGILLQHRIMIEPLEYLRVLEDEYKAFSQNKDVEGKYVPRIQSKYQEFFYKVQISSFLISFLILTLSLIIKPI